MRQFGAVCCNTTQYFIRQRCPDELTSSQNPIRISFFLILPRRRPMLWLLMPWSAFLSGEDVFQRRALKTTFLRFNFFLGRLNFAQNRLVLTLQSVQLNFGYFPQRKAPGALGVCWKNTGPIFQGETRTKRIAVEVRFLSQYLVACPELSRFMLRKSSR